MKRRKGIAAIAGVLFSMFASPDTALSNTGNHQIAVRPVSAECLVRASEQFSIPIPVIIGILATEGGRVGMESPNRNGTFDLGPMQINDRVWVPVLAQALGGDQQRARQLLRDDGCANVAFGTWILHQHMRSTGGDLARAIGWYHSRTPVHMNRYQEKFRENLSRIMMTARTMDTGRH